MNVSKTQRWEWMAIGISLVLLLIVGSVYVHDRILHYTDSIAYINAAKSLVKGEGYSVNGAPATTWPPAYSCLLAISMLLGFDSIAVYKILNLLLLAGAVIFWWRALRIMTDRRTALLAAVAGGLFFPSIYYSQAILAESLMSFAVSALFFAATRFAKSDNTRSLIWLTVTAMFIPLVKLAGLAFLVGWVYVAVLDNFRIRNIFKHRKWSDLWKTALAGLIVLAPLTIWCVRNWILTGSPTGYDLGATSEYMSSLAKIGITEEPTLLTRLMVAGRGYSHILIIPDQSGIDRIGKLPLVMNLAAIAVSGAVLIGWGRALLDKVRRPAAVMFALYGGLLMMNAWYDVRYLLSIMPLYFFFLADAAGVLVGVPARRMFDRVTVLKPLLKNHSIQIAILAVLVLAFMAFHVVAPQAKSLRKATYKPSVQNLFEACRYMKNASESGGILKAGGRGFVPLWSDREVVSLLGRLDKNNELESLDIPEGVRFLLLDESKFAPYREMYMEPVVAANSNKLVEVFRKDDTIVYRVQN